MKSHHEVIANSSNRWTYVRGECGRPSDEPTKVGQSFVAVLILVDAERLRIEACARKRSLELRDGAQFAESAVYCSAHGGSRIG